MANFPCECDGKSKELVMNKLPNKRFFIAAEKWMVRRTGVALFLFKREPTTVKTLESFFALLRFAAFDKRGTNTKINKLV